MRDPNQKADHIRSDGELSHRRHIFCRILLIDTGSIENEI
jgi:hypothetical protein